MGEFGLVTIPRPHNDHSFIWCIIRPVFEKIRVCQRDDYTTWECIQIGPLTKSDVVESVLLQGAVSFLVCVLILLEPIDDHLWALGASGFWVQSLALADEPASAGLGEGLQWHGPLSNINKEIRATCRVGNQKYNFTSTFVAEDIIRVDLGSTSSCHGGVLHVGH